MPERVRTAQTLERVKFVCKELWMALWEKQVDNLRTNHRVRRRARTDRRRACLSCRTPRSARCATRTPRRATSPRYVRALTQQLAFATGVVQGALQRLGVAASVHADAAHAPQCTSPPLTAGAFHVRVAS